MARKARPTTNTLVSYIAPDDDAITNPEGYEEYLSTADVSHLDLSGEPGRYWLRPLNSRQWQRLVDVFKLVKEGEEGERDIETIVNMSRTYSEVALECLVGCDGHPVVSKVNEDGSFEQEIVTWPVGSNRPKGLEQELEQDTVLVSGIVDFLVRVSTLTEKEKNR